MTNLNFEHVPATLADLDVTGTPSAGTVPIFDGGAGRYTTRAPVIADISGLQAALDLKLNAAEAYTRTVSDGRYGRLDSANAWTAAQTMSSSSNLDNLVLVNTGSPSLKLNTSSANAAARNWGFSTNNFAFGDFTLYQSSTLGGNPFLGTSRLTIGAGGIGIGGITNPQATLNLPAGNGSANNGILFGSDAYMFRGSGGQLSFNGTTVGAVSISSGLFYGLGTCHSSSGNNSTVGTTANGTVISRNVADANPALTVSQLNAASTGDIVNFRNNAGIVVNIRQNGYMGIGVTPTHMLDVKAPTTETIAMTFAAGVSGYKVGFGGTSQAAFIQGYTSADSAYHLALQTAAGGNLGVFTANQFGGGTGVIGIGNCTSAPNSSPTGGGVIYVESGALKFRGSSGTVTQLAPA